MAKSERKNDKNHDTGLRMLNILKILLNKNLSRKNLLLELKASGIVDRIYTPEALLKYFNTFEAAGLQIEKQKTKYTLKNGFYNLVLSNSEKELLWEVISNYTRLQNPVVSAYYIQSFLNKLEKYTDIDFASRFEEKIKEENDKNKDNIKSGLVSLLEKYIQEKLGVKITYIKNEKVIEDNGSVILVNEDKEYVILYIKQEQKNKKIKLSSILKTEQLPQRIEEAKRLNPVTFEVSGRLAYSYKLKPDEVSLSSDKFAIIVSNSQPDRDALILRLLKYGENCKVKKPVDFKEDYLSVLDKMIENLESDV